MPNLSKLSKWFKKGDVKNGDHIIFINAGELVSKDFNGKPSTVLEIGVELPDGSIKTYTPNATTWKGLSEVWGSNTEDWIGKKAKVNFVNAMVQGKMKEVIVCVPA